MRPPAVEPLPTVDYKDRLQPLVFGHLVVLVLLATWGLGGNAPWSRTAVQLWGTVGMLLTGWILWRRRAGAADHVRPRRWLWPLAALNALVLASLANPSFRAMQLGAEVMLVRSGGHPLLPGSARPGETADALWLFDAVFLSCFNLALAARHRQALRGFLIFLCANGLALAVFGSFQKFLGATGPYFGAVTTRQSHFFSSFIYHNHWGAFAVLMTAVGIGLVLRYLRHTDAAGFWSSPGFAVLVAVFFIAASIPLSLSRSSSLLVFALLSVAILQFLRRLIRQRRSQGLPFAGPLFTAILLAGAALGGAYKIAEPSILIRLAKTEEQLATMRAQGTIGSRVALYTDTWHMARDRPWFGWGMGSYPTVFYSYNTQQAGPDRLPKFYWDAHSDWLQSLAELGFVGTSLIGLLGLLPLLSLRRRHLRSPITAYLLGGCGLILLYAWVEFPFGNVAVVLLWWLCFFAALRYARLESLREEEPAA
jgi:O-antigen ligase